MDAAPRGRDARRGFRASAGWRRQRRVLLCLALLAPAGCRGTGDLTARLVPKSWRGNPWGPEAEEARARGELPAVPVSPPMLAWEDWGRRHLREGDILFRMGDARAAFGLFPFSKISAEMADSRYSHTGIVAIEEGELVVYDTTRTGPRRQPFSVWILDTVDGLAVKRPRSEYRRHIPEAVAFSREVYHQQVPFDLALELGHDRFYCIELTESSYRAAGLPLSDPVRIDSLPRYHEFPNVVRLVRLFSNLRPDQPAFVIGNHRIGLWSSPALELVYEAPDARLPYDPPAPMAIASAPGPQPR